MQTQHMPASALMHAKTYDAKENAVRNALQPTSANIQTATACRPASAPSFGNESPYIEHTRRDSKGGTVTKRYLKGTLLGKGGFAKCYKITDVETNKDWACKVVQKSSLTKQRHKVKVRVPSVSSVATCPTHDALHTRRCQGACRVALLLLSLLLVLVRVCSCLRGPQSCVMQAPACPCRGCSKHVESTCTAKTSGPDCVRAGITMRARAISFKRRSRFTSL